MQTSVVAHAEGHSILARAKSRISVSALLVWLVLACLLPEVLGVSAIFYHEYLEGQAQLDKDMAQSVRNKVQRVDVELAQVALFAQALATSGTLTRHELARFHQRSVSLISKADIELTVVLFDKTAQQLVNTKIPWGQSLPKRFDVEPVRRVFATSHADSPTLIFRASDGLPVISTLIPVFSNQQVKYVLAVAFVPEKFNSILSPNGSAIDAITTIVDSTGTIAARSHESAQFVGKKVAPDIWTELQKKQEGVFSFNLNNASVLKASYSTSSSTGWRVLTMTPQDSLDVPLMRSLGLMANGAVLVLVLSMGLAWLLGRRIVNSVRSLKMAAVAFGSGELVTLPDVNLRETDEVAQALNKSALLLKARTKELLDSNKTLSERTTELAEAQHIAQIGNWTWIFKTNHRVASAELLRQFGPKVLLPFDEQAGVVFPPEAWQKLDTAIKATVQLGVGYALELNVLNKEDALIWVKARGEAVFSSTGEVTGLRGTMQDITEYKTNEASLLENKMRLQMALSSSDLALWDWHIQSGDLFFEARWAAIQGYALNEVPFRYERYMQDVFSEDIPLIQKNLEAHFHGGAPKYEAIYRVRHKDGHDVWVQGTGRVVERDADGNPVRMLGVALDISERKQNESTMEALHDEMNAMLVWQVAQHTVAALAHEINQPLASASILCEAASRMARVNDPSVKGVGNTPNRQQETLKHIASEIERAGTVLRSLLISVNKPDITRATEVVNELVGESIQMALGEGVFGYQIIKDFTADLPLVKVNRLQLSKVLLNLIHNGAQAMQGAQTVKGKIVVSTGLVSGGGEICVSVQDDGPGISALMQQEIFQPYISTKSHGLGLGLTISRALIEAHGGKLWATQVEGQGATFHFTLPTAG